ncbi:MAG TPA: VOC family protein [Candidatus Caenarcaniphilales bacterium]
MQVHHTSIRTADIHRAIAFYGQLGFEIQAQFTTGYTLACWLAGAGGRLELIQIPEPHPAPDPFHDEHYVGYYHLSFDLTQVLGSKRNLAEWLANLQARLAAQSLPLQILLPPTQQIIGDRCYKVAFIADPDGLPLEFLQDLGAAAEMKV